MTSEVRKCPKWGFCAVYRPPGTPYGRRKSGIFIFLYYILYYIIYYILYIIYIYIIYYIIYYIIFLHYTPRRTTYKKISYLPVPQTRHFWEKHVFLNFSRFLQKYRISIYISIIHAPNKRRFISIDPQGITGDYGVSVFFWNHQFDELRNQKCKTHFKKLTAMKFRNSKKLSYRSNHLGKTYSEKN